jgi:hypothetical protein
VVALALLLVTTVIALILARRYHLGVAAVTVGILGGFPGLYLAWASYRDVGGGKVPSLRKVADELAVAVGAQWNTEAGVRRLNDPYPLPVRWVAADPSLADGWDVLVKLATSGAGWPSPPPPETWAAGPDDLAGHGSDLVNVLARVPTGRLMVLGEPGAGKSMLMVRLVLDLLARRVSGGPVPVLASLASWNPADTAQDLHSWLSAQLTLDYPGLSGAAPPGAGEGTRAEALLAAGKILPILDGLDEIPDAVRGSAITRINDGLMPGEQVVVTCRSEQYQDTVRPLDGAEVTLRSAAAVRLCPLNADEVSQYLRDDAGGPAVAARWEPVLAALGSQSPAGQALATPLMVGLARAIYNPRPGERPGDVRDPAELRSPALTDPAAVERHLFDAFIPAVYRPGASGRWTAQKAETWLVFLARHLEHTIHSPDLAWWQLEQAVPRAVAGRVVGTATGLVVGVVAGLATGYMSGLTGVAAGLASGVGTGVGTGLVVRARGVTRATRPRRGLRLSMAGTMIGVVLGIACGIGVGIGSAGNGDGPAKVLTAGILTGVGVGLVLALMSGLRPVPGDLAAAATPRALLTRDRRTALVVNIYAAPVAVVMGGCGALLAVISVLAAFGGGSRPDARVPIVGVAVTAVVAGLIFGVIAEYIFGVVGGAWPSYVFARGLLALRNRLPWPLMPFLADAHQRGVLRQAGAVYQFRHIELQHHLATEPIAYRSDPLAGHSDMTERD